MPRVLQLLTALASVSVSLSAAIVVESQGQAPQQHQLQVAFACPPAAAPAALPAVVWLADPAGGSGRWHVDPRLTGCPASAAGILAFCRVAYPHIRDFVNVEPASEPVTVPNWCPADSAAAADCLPLTVTPQLCLTSSFKPDSLLVPSGCRFDHRAADNPRDPAECRSVSEWRQVAQGRCTIPGQSLRTHSLLLPCSGAGQFAGVEFVCCPEDPTERPRLTAAEDRDREILQRYLALPTLPSVSESERYAQASGSLGRINQAQEARLESRMSQEENRILKRGSPARRLVSDILAHYRRSFESLQRQESAERLQLDSVHEDRLSGGVRASLQRLRRMMGTAVDSGRKPEALGYLRELARLTAAEANRVANQAVAMATDGRLSAEQLDSAKRHQAGLQRQLDEARRILGGGSNGADADQALLEPRDGLRRARAAVDRLTPSPALIPTPDGGDPDLAGLAARFAEILRRHAARDWRRVQAAEPADPAVPQRHQLLMPDDRLALMPHPHPMASSGGGGSVGALIGVLGGFAALLAIGIVAMATIRGGGGRGCLTRCLVQHRRPGGCGGGTQGYKLTLVDEQPAESQPPLPPHQQQLLQQSRHLTCMQANGYENPTYKFYEG